MHYMQLKSICKTCNKTCKKYAKYASNMQVLMILPYNNSLYCMQYAKYAKKYARYAKYANIIFNMQNMCCPLCWWSSAGQPDSEAEAPPAFVCGTSCQWHQQSGDSESEVRHHSPGSANTNQYAKYTLCLAQCTSLHIDLQFTYYFAYHSIIDAYYFTIYAPG
jgi:hypothetical protein